jgi:hypothetical protein
MRRTLVLAGMGLGATLAFLISRVIRLNRSESSNPWQGLREHIVDDRGTTQREAAKILLNLRNRGFEASDEKFALALGHSAAEIEAFYSGREVIDDDLIMKARSLAIHRGVTVE